MDPYETLGISAEATKDEIRKAYIELIKKNHPDKFSDPEAKKAATLRTVELNTAYSLVQRRLKSSYAPGSTASGAESTVYTGKYAAEFLLIREYLSKNALTMAKNTLDAIPLRNGEWHYLSALLAMRRGLYGEAKTHSYKAYTEDTNNIEYQRAYNTISALSEKQSAGGRERDAKRKDPCGRCAFRFLGRLACKNCKKRRY